MSHFSVLVVAQSDEIMKAKLAPYQENNMGECPAEYLAFHDIEDEYRKQYESESVERIQMGDGRLLTTWDDEFRVSGRFGHGAGTHRIPEHLPKIEVPLRETFATFEDYMSEWCGYEVRDTKEGRFGYWENPNKKWDWYTIGGRWSGELMLKPISEAAGIFPVSRNGAGGAFNEANALLSRADIARIRDVDWEGMRQEEMDAARKKWQAMQTLKQMELDERPKSKRSDFAWENGLGMLRNDSPLITLETEEEYVNHEANDGLTWAFINVDGKWIERADMGWWGAHGDIQPDYGAAWWSLIKNAPDDLYVYIIDCHI